MLRRLRLSAVAITGDLWGAIALVFGELKELSNRPSAPKAHQVTVFLRQLPPLWQGPLTAPPLQHCRERRQSGVPWTQSPQANAACPALDGCGRGFTVGTVGQDVRQPCTTCVGALGSGKRKRRLWES